MTYDEEPAVVLSAGPVYSRDAEPDDPPYEPPRQPLGFVVCWRPRDVDEDGMVHPVWVGELGPLRHPGDVDPILWDGDQA